jgi:putrescine transport system permease protein
VFVPAVGEYVIPELVGNSSTMMIGGILWDEFFQNRDWPLAAAIALVTFGLLMPEILLGFSFLMLFASAQALTGSIGPFTRD